MEVINIKVGNIKEVAETYCTKDNNNIIEANLFQQFLILSQINANAKGLDVKEMQKNVELMLAIEKRI